MADLVRFQILTLPPCRIVGRALKVDPKEANPIPAFWEDCFQQGYFFKAGKNGGPLSGDPPGCG